MTHRCPFQPPPFCDSLISSSVHVLFIVRFGQTIFFLLFVEQTKGKFGFNQIEMGIFYKKKIKRFEVFEMFSDCLF